MTEPVSEPSSGVGTPMPPGKIAALTALVVVMLAIAITVPLLINHLVQNYAVRTVKVPVASMEPAIEVDDRILVDRISYRFDDPSRGDVVVYESGPDDDLAARVIATGGQTVQCCDPAHRVLVDGVAVDEPYLFEPGAPQPAFEPFRVPAGHVWVMGDNRNNSVPGLAVDEDDVVGRAVLVIWPTGHWGSIDDEQTKEGLGDGPGP